MDNFYMWKAKQASLESTCNKKKLGCLLVLANRDIISGANGPPFPLKQCEPCPRIVRGSITGADLYLCRAVHAERKVILEAAKRGISTRDSTLYSYMGVPCKDCMVELIAAGVSEIVCIRETYYDELSKNILKEWIAGGGRFRIRTIY